MAFFPHFEIFPTKIVKNIILRNTHVLETTAKQAEWRPPRDQDGKNTSLGFVCVCLVA